MPDSEQNSLQCVEFLEGLSEGSRKALERRCIWKSFGKNELIVGHLDSSDDVFFLISGRARVMLYSVSGKSVVFRDIGSGDVFGELAAIDGRPRSASIEALKPCQVAVIPGSAFLDMLAAEPDVSLALTQHLAQQVRDLTDRIFEFSTFAVKNRIHAELLRLARGGSWSAEEVRIESAPTHEELASRISTHRQAVTREFNRLAQMGLIKRQGRTLYVRDIARLERLVEDATGE